jgi:hypothetical protein
MHQYPVFLAEAPGNGVGALFIDLFFVDELTEPAKLLGDFAFIKQTAARGIHEYLFFAGANQAWHRGCITPVKGEYYHGYAQGQQEDQEPASPFKTLPAGGRGRLKDLVRSSSVHEWCCSILGWQSCVHLAEYGTA